MKRTMSTVVAGETALEGGEAMCGRAAAGQRRLAGLFSVQTGLFSGCFRARLRTCSLRNGILEIAGRHAEDVGRKPLDFARPEPKRRVFRVLDEIPVHVEQRALNYGAVRRVLPQIRIGPVLDHQEGEVEVFVEIHGARVVEVDLVEFVL